MAINARLRFEILERDDFKCQYCGRSGGEVPLHVDHRHPRSKGGTDDSDNLVTACRECNIGKFAREMDYGSMLSDRIMCDPRSSLDTAVTVLETLAGGVFHGNGIYLDDVTWEELKRLSRKMRELRDYHKEHPEIREQITQQWIDRFMRDRGK